MENYMMTTKQLLLKQKYNKKTAIKCGKKNISYAELHTWCQRIGKHVGRLSSKSSNVGIVLPNSIDYAKAFFGVLFANKIVVPINAQLKPLELMHALRFCEIDLILTNSSTLDHVLKATKDYPYRLKIFLVDNMNCVECNTKLSYIDKTEKVKKNIKSSDTTILLHTSGSTESSRYVMLTHRNILYNVKANVKSLNLKSSDITLIALPMDFAYCNTAQFLSCIYLGATMIILPNMFLPINYLSTIEREKVTNIFVVPTMLLILTRLCCTKKYNLDTLRLICIGGSKIYKSSLAEVADQFPKSNICITYGLTECSPRVTTLAPNLIDKKEESIGRPILYTKVRIENSSNNVDGKEIGEICVKGKSVMKGYYKQPYLTQQIIRDGWLHTGDLGYIDDEGFLYLTGRIKNVIIYKGINIYPEEIEELLIKHPNIIEAIVYGKKDAILGEIPVSKVVLNEKGKNEISEEAIKTFCSKYLADYKVPKHIYFVDSLEKTMSGKLLRRGN